MTAALISRVEEKRKEALKELEEVRRLRMLAIKVNNEHKLLP
jgi:hypothetical protein